MFPLSHENKKVKLDLCPLFKLFSPQGASLDFCRLLSRLLMCIANTMDPDQILFASMKKSSLKCTWISAAEVKSRQHFHAKKIMAG